MPKKSKQNKHEMTVIRVMVNLKGKTKRLFVEEIERTGEFQAVLARNIITSHYERLERNHKMKYE